jgi:ribosomal protein L1
MTLDRTITRSTRFAVVPVKEVRAINPLNDDDVVKAAKEVGPDMISALEDMVNAAKAGRLEGQTVLAIGAAAWPTT